MKTDQKEALSNVRKADTTHVRSAFRRYIARACEYGTAKGYERANYLRPVATRDENGDGPPAADLQRFRAYLRAAVDHFSEHLDALEQLESQFPGFDGVSWDIARDVAYCPDTDVKPGSGFGPSLLPHAAHGAASAMMAIEQAVLWGLLPVDPGDAWNHGDEPFKREKDRKPCDESVECTLSSCSVECSNDPDYCPHCFGERDETS